jgi:hypothetical protein
MKGDLHPAASRFGDHDLFRKPVRIKPERRLFGIMRYWDAV